MEPVGMGAFCPCCHSKISTGVRTHEDMMAQYPAGCPYCHGSTAAQTTRAAADAAAKKAGYLYLDMHGDPIRPLKEPKK